MKYNIRCYTKDYLEPVVKESRSFAEVLRKLGLKQNGSTQHFIKIKSISLGINFSHFYGKASNRGEDHKPNRKLPWTTVLVRNRTGRREVAGILRNAMTDFGIPYECSICGQKPLWNSKPLRIQVDHINGDNIDNTPENIRFLCPNCHSQTDTFGIKNIN